MKNGNIRSLSVVSHASLTAAAPVKRCKVS